MFLFATYTGLRWGDVSVLTRKNLITTDEGILLNIKAAKTGKTFQLPLWIMFEGKAQDLALKYWPATETGKLFPNLNNAYANRALKKLAISANIKKHLHFHASRHTIGTILAQTAGVLTAKDVLQHSKLDTTMGYLHLSNAERNKSLEDVKNWY
jgi:integrase